MRCLVYLLTFTVFATVAAQLPMVEAPVVRLDEGTFIGTTDGITDAFLGIKFAEAPCACGALFVHALAFTLLLQSLPLASSCPSL